MIPPSRFGLGRPLPIWLVAAFLGAFFIPLRLGSSQALWQAKVAPDLQGRVFAVRPVFGSGPGRGYALTMMLLGLFTAVIYLLGALVPAICAVQRDLPDAVAVQT